MARPRWANESWGNHQEYIRRAQLKGKLKDEEEIVNFLTLAMCGEAGEFANLIKKGWRGDEVDRQKLSEELADVRIYMEHLATHLLIHLDAACDAKVLKVTERLKDEAA